MNIKIILTFLIVVVAVVAGTIWFQLQDKKETQESMNMISEALEESVVETPQVSSEVNAMKQVLPTVNPIEKTNPFKNEYKNPFE